PSFVVSKKLDAPDSHVLTDGTSNFLKKHWKYGSHGLLQDNVTGAPETKNVIFS
ncbi:unnamed protein product, partial [Orchesella dallaii]